MQKPGIAKGTRDFGPEQVQKRKYILDVLESIFRKYGFMPIETPAMENLSTLEGKYGEEGDKLLFRILNSGDAFSDIKKEKGSLSVDQVDWKPGMVSEKGLRYDLTVPFARYVVMNRNEITFPFKRYQMQPVWRADRPQRGRYREFWQCDADVVGSDSLLNEVDLIQIYVEAFSRLGIKVKVLYNNRKILDGLAEILGLQDRLTEMTVILDKKDKVGLEAVVAELRGLGADETKLSGFVSCLSEAFDPEKWSTYFSTSITATKGLQELREISEMLNQLLAVRPGQNYDHLIHDLSLARGLSYYTGSIFEVVADDERSTFKSSIGGGGRYDNLTGIFGLPNISGVGISFGLDRIYDVMEELNLFPPSLNITSTQVLICAMDEQTRSYGYTSTGLLRDAGISAEFYPEQKKLGKQLDYANALKIPYAIIIGESERAAGRVTLKNLKAGTQELLSLEQAIDTLKNRADQS